MQTYTKEALKTSCLTLKVTYSPCRGWGLICPGCWYVPGLLLINEAKAYFIELGWLGTSWLIAGGDNTSSCLKGR